MDRIKENAMRPKKPKWKNVKTIKDAQKLIDMEILLRWTEARYLVKHLPLDRQIGIMKRFVKAVCEKREHRLACEIYSESMLLWLSVSMNDSLMKAIASQFFVEKNGLAGCQKLVEMALTSDITDVAHQEGCLEVAVILVCDIGKSLVSRKPKRSPEIQQFLSHLTTYLLSVSNQNNYAIRLSLLHYFGFLSREGYHQIDFERIMNRFGYTVLDFVFFSSFQKDY